MKFEVDRGSDEAGEPSIEEMTEKAIKILQKNPKGYFLLVEGLSLQRYTPIKVTQGVKTTTTVTERRTVENINDQKHQLRVIVVLMHFMHFIAVLCKTMT